MEYEKKTVHLISLGCPKNLVDSEYLLGLLAEQGWVVRETPEAAELIIINTCAFIRSAVEESIATILEAAEYKTGFLAVVGCLPQRYQNELVESLPEVDLFWGTGRLDELAGILANPDRVSDAPFKFVPGFVPGDSPPRLRSAPFYRAYLKVADGCSNACSYCMIPRLRGPYRSRPLPILVEEAAALAESGVRELILVAQDTTAYGRDLKPAVSLAHLLTALAKISGLEWLRIMYTYPAGIDDELLAVLASEPKVVPYLDLPLQHASPTVLKRMHRRGPADLLALLTRLRNAVPGLTLRTTMMVGFPGETPQDFEYLLDFVARARFEHLGVFKFFPEDGVKAAEFPDQVSGRLKENRRRKLMALQRRISKAANQSLVGRTMPVLIEGRSSETDLLLVGRTPAQAPDIDGQVYINKGTASAGEIRPVLITEAHDYDLVGEIVT